MSGGRLESPSLAVGMVLREDLRSDKEFVLIAQGQEVNFAMLVRLRQFARTSFSKEPFRVLIPPATSHERPRSTEEMERKDDTTN